MWYVTIFYFQWMYVFQLLYQATYAGRNKRQMKYFQWENVVDTLIFLINMQYLVVLLRKYRYDSFLSNPDPVTEARLYFHQYTESFVNEGLFLWIIGVCMWVKAFN